MLENLMRNSIKTFLSPYGFSIKRGGWVVIPQKAMKILFTFLLNPDGWIRMTTIGKLGKLVGYLRIFTLKIQVKEPIIFPRNIKRLSLR